MRVSPRRCRTSPTGQPAGDRCSRGAGPGVAGLLGQLWETRARAEPPALPPGWGTARPLPGRPRPRHMEKRGGGWEGAGPRVQGLLQLTGPFLLFLLGPGSGSRGEGPWAERLGRASGRRQLGGKEPGPGATELTPASVSPPVKRLEAEPCRRRGPLWASVSPAVVCGGVITTPAQGAAAMETVPGR